MRKFRGNTVASALDLQVIFYTEGSLYNVVTSQVISTRFAGKSIHNVISTQGLLALPKYVLLN